LKGFAKHTGKVFVFVSCIGLAALLLVGLPGYAAPVTSSTSSLRAVETSTPVTTGVTPHRAIYTVRLGSAKNGSHISDIGGRMLFSWVDDCHAWNIEQKMQIRFFYSEGEVEDSVTDLTSREAKDGSDYYFHVRRNGDEKEKQEIWRGSATLSVDAASGLGTGEAVYAGDDARKIKLTGASFPAHHTMQLLEAARAGRKFFAVNVFDGADEKGLNEISAFISPPTPAASAIEKASGKMDENPLLKAKSWPVRMAFFSPDSETGSPDYEMDMTLLDNGIIKTMKVDYGEFSMIAELADVKPLPAAKCSGL
jgi:hypothetical protein